ncbi:MAG: hypothetical protein CVU39_23305 [Chloroflexi bacterium HGW-Chloroflexi-10]|nr:MAG: hypothetical protein CVU39_23305 [Chloroflexi bacterium HGW-Chloroflexi-10]
MVVCPWCGTYYEVFQSSCKRCGGPLQPQEAAFAQREDLPLMPSPAPRPISKNYAWKLMFSDALAIVGLIFAVLGAIFSVVGFGLTIGVITAFVGIPFLFLGMGFFVIGCILAYTLYQEKQKIVNVLINGEAVLGKIVEVEENLMVTVNNRHPWNISYQFRYNGTDYEGSVTTLQVPGAGQQSGKAAYILYTPTDPKQNALYPHP